MSGLDLGPPTDPPDLDDLDTDSRVELMVEWFNENFEDPAHITPHDSGEGGYQWIWGGPYDAREQLQTYFDQATEEEIEAAVAEIELDGLEWAPAQNRIQPDGPGDDDDRPLAPLQVRLARLSGELNEIEEQLKQWRLNMPALMGHNQPPKEFQNYIDSDEISDALNSIEEVKNELKKPDPADNGDPEIIVEAESRLRRVANKIKLLIKAIGEQVIKGALTQLGKDLFEDPMGLIVKIENAANTLAVWTQHLHLPF